MPAEVWNKKKIRVWFFTVNRVRNVLYYAPVIYCTVARV